MAGLIRHRPARNIVPSPKFVCRSEAVADQSGVKAVSDKPFLTDVKTLRERARQHIEKGAVTEGYSADRDTVVKILNEALATEIVCVLRYKRHYFMASGIHAEGVAAEFLQHANEEQGHADLIAQRIVQLGGEPNFNPDGLTMRSHAEYVEGNNLLDMIKEDLVAERIAIDSYREMVNYVSTDDPTTRRMLEGILAMEEEHADDLVNLLSEIGG
jgi:bacterioferritin